MHSMPTVYDILTIQYLYDQDSRYTTNTTKYPILRVYNQDKVIIPQDNQGANDNTTRRPR